VITYTEIGLDCKAVGEITDAWPDVEGAMASSALLEFYGGNSDPIEAVAKANLANGVDGVPFSLADGTEFVEVGLTAPAYLVPSMSTTAPTANGPAYATGVHRIPVAGYKYLHWKRVSANVTVSVTCYGEKVG